jgi:effector-binding domain-containing protein
MPIDVDKWTGYRMYSVEQLNLMADIMSFKHMGFSLDEIKLLIKENQKESFYADKLKELQNEKTNLENKINELTSYLEKLKGVKVMEKIVIKSIPSVIVASYRKIIKNYDELNQLSPEIIMPELKRLNCKNVNYCFNIYHDKEYKETNIDVEICEGVDEIKSGSSILKFKKMNEIPMAVCLFHKGSYSSLNKSYAEVMKYIEKNGYTIADDIRESYIDGIWNKANVNEWLTEIQVPVKKNI